MGEQAAVKGRFDGLAAGGGVPGVPASDHLCGVENELFAIVCLLHKGCVRGWDAAEGVALSIYLSFFLFKIQNTSVQASFFSLSVNKLQQCTIFCLLQTHGSSAFDACVS